MNQNEAEYAGKKQRKNATKHKRGRNRRLYVRIGIVLLVLFFVSALIYRFSQESAASLGTLRTQEITERSYAKLDGYVFRDESLLYADKASLIDYKAQDGEKMAVGYVYATAYAYTPTEEQSLSDLQIRLDEINTRLHTLMSGQSGTAGLAGIKESTKIANDAYQRILEGIERNRFDTVAKYSKKMLKQLSRRQILTDSEGAEGVDADIGALQSRKSQLLAALGDGEPLENTQSAWFYRNADGFESFFSADAAQTMRAQELTDLIAHARQYVAADNANEENTVDAGMAIGKVTYAADWYLVLEAPRQVLLGYEVGDTLTPIFEDEDDAEIPMTVARILYPDSDEMQGYLVLTTDVIPGDFTFSRMQTVRLITDTVSGYRVPESALISTDLENDQYGVYILSGNTVELRSVQILRRCDGYCIVESYEDAVARDQELAGIYLQKNDLLITAGTNLYVGKIYY